MKKIYDKSSIREKVFRVIYIKILLKYYVINNSPK